MRIDHDNMTESDYGFEKIGGVTGLARQTTISAFMIVKNEEKNIGAAIECLSPLAEEIVIVDTGSTDDTLKLACHHMNVNAKVKLFQTEWKDDFAAARNHAAKRCTGDWIIWFDADDRIDIEAVKLIRGLVLCTEQQDWALPLQKMVQLGRAYFIFNVDCPTSEGYPGTMFMQPRMYPNSPMVTWAGHIHEKFMESAEADGMTGIKVPGIIIRHTGYTDPEACKAKAERNLEMMAGNPDTAMGFYQQAREQMALKRWEQALELLQRAPFLAGFNERLNEEVEYLRARCCIELRRYGVAMQVLDTLKRPEAVFFMAYIRQLQSRYDDADEYARHFLENSKLTEKTNEFGDDVQLCRINAWHFLVGNAQRRLDDLRKRSRIEFPSLTF